MWHVLISAFKTCYIFIATFHPSSEMWVYPKTYFHMSTYTKSRVSNKCYRNVMYEYVAAHASLLPFASKAGHSCSAAIFILIILFPLFLNSCHLNNSDSNCTNFATEVDGIDIYKMTPRWIWLVEPLGRHVGLRQTRKYSKAPLSEGLGDRIFFM